MTHINNHIIIPLAGHVLFTLDPYANSIKHPYFITKDMDYMPYKLPCFQEPELGFLDQQVHLASIRTYNIVQSPQHILSRMFLTLMLVEIHTHMYIYVLYRKDPLR